MTQNPNPGSEEAVALGCICDPEENDYGRGHEVVRVNERGNEEVLTFPSGATRAFKFDAACPLHGAGDWAAPA